MSQSFISKSINSWENSTENTRINYIYKQATSEFAMSTNRREKIHCVFKQTRAGFTISTSNSRIHCLQMLTKYLL